MNSLKDISKWIQFYEASAVQPTYLLKRELLQRKNFNNYAKILVTPILHRGTTREAYLEPSQTSAMELFYKNY